MFTVLLVLVALGPRLLGVLLGERAPRFIWIVSLVCIPAWLGLLALDAVHHVRPHDPGAAWGQFIGAILSGFLAALFVRHDWERLHGRRWPNRQMYR